MSALEEPRYLSVEEYLKLEETSEIRHEYVDGEIYAMSGGTDAHGTLNFNLTSLIRPHLRGGPCRGYSGNIRLYVEEANTYYYPDLFVTCDERDRTPAGEKQYACLVIEVLSPTTEGIDRGAKFRHYRQVPTLQEYVLVRQDGPGVECYRRGAGGDWVLREYGESDVLPLQSIRLDLPVSAIYEDVEFAASPLDASSTA